MTDKAKDMFKGYVEVCIARDDYYWSYDLNKGALFLTYKFGKSNGATPLAPSVINKLIQGKIAIGLSPFTDNENVLYGGIDLDAHDDTEEQQKEVEVDLKKLTKELNKLGYLYFVNSSGSKGKHIRVYSNEPCNAKVMRYFLKDLQERILGLEKHETFPKQDKLDPETKPFGNQMKAVLSLHPKYKKLSGIIVDDEILSLEDSLKFIYEFSKKIPKAKTIEFEITKEIEKKYKAKTFKSDLIFTGQTKAPNYCSAIEEVMVELPLPSSNGATKHNYLDANVGVYLLAKKDKKEAQEMQRSYCEKQQRNNTAFNGCEKHSFSCAMNWTYIKANYKDENVQRMQDCCEKCSLFSKQFIPEMKTLIENKDNAEKTNKIIKDILEQKAEVIELDIEPVIEQIISITGKRETTLLKTWKKFRTNTLKKEITTSLKTKDKINLNDKQTLKKIRTIVFDLIIVKKLDEASEYIRDIIKDNESIFTIRDDEKSEMWIYKNGIFVPEGRSYIEEICRNILGKGFTTYRANQVIKKIDVDTRIERDNFFRTNYINEIAVENGILNLKEKKLYPFTSKKIFFNKLPIIYDEQKMCENIDKHFDTILISEEDKKLMYELFGFCLWKDYFIECAFMFIGDGRNGKSKTMELLKRFLGSNNVTSQPLHKLEDDPYAIAYLFGCLANIAPDIDSRAMKYTGTLKSITGRDEQSAQRKFKNNLNFVPFAKQIFGCNELPQTYDKSFAFWERMKTIEFPYKFVCKDVYDKLNEEDKKIHKIKDVDIMSKLIKPNEMSGLLNKAIEGLHNLLKKKEFSYNKTTEEVKRFWIMKSDSFMAFCNDCLEETNEYVVIKAQLKKAYFDYCRKNKLKINITDKGIKETLIQGFAVDEIRNTIGNKREMCWYGVKFKEKIEDLEKMKKENYNPYGTKGLDGYGFSIYRKKGSFTRGKKPSPSKPFKPQITIEKV